MLIDQSIARIRAYRAAQGWSVLRLAKEAGLNESTIRHLDSEGWSPTADTLRKLESVVPEGWSPGDTITASRNSPETGHA